jgi:peptidoglycan hydrolase-like protein with peptidoglycan-binding domain
MKKYIGILFILSLLVIPAFSFAQVDDSDPEPTSDCVALQNNLRYRDRDSNKNGEVSTLQDFLQSKEYFNSEPTGYFGLLTVKGVKAFQKDNNIKPDGHVGPFTRAKIKALTCGTIIPPKGENGQEFKGYLSPIGSTTYMWGTHTLSISSDFVCSTTSCPQITPGNSYPVSGQNDSVKSDLKLYEARAKR